MNSHFLYSDYDVYIIKHGIIIYCSLAGIAGSNPAGSMDRVCFTRPEESHSERCV